MSHCKVHCKLHLSMTCCALPELLRNCITPVGNATLVVANVLTCNKHSPSLTAPCITVMSCPAPLLQVLPRWVVYHELVLTSKEFMRTVREGGQTEDWI
jgi:hypothetical protein